MCYKSKEIEKAQFFEHFLSFKTILKSTHLFAAPFLMRIKIGLFESPICFVCKRESVSLFPQRKLP